MRKLKRFLACTLTAAMFAAALSGCGGNAGGAASSAPAADSVVSTSQAEQPADTTQAAETPAAETPEEVTLTMYLLGDRTPDFDLVFDKINEKMKAEINATLEVKFMGWGEYEQKYPLVFASGEDFDLIYSADWAMYNAQASKQGFYEITKEMLETYAPKTAATIYDDAWEQSKVDGKVYMLPMNYKELTAYVFFVRGDLMEKYGIDQVNSIDDIEAYLQAVADNDPGMIPLDIGSDFDDRFLYDLFWQAEIAGRLEKVNPEQLMGYIESGDDSATVFNETEDPAFLTTVEKLKDWKDRGFWSKSAVVNTQNNKESFAAGKSATALMNINNAKGEYTTLMQAHPEWDIRVVDAQGKAPAIVQSYLANGMCVFSKSKNPERALMALDLLRNDEEIHDLFCYGIEGVHYTSLGDGKIELTDANENYPYDGNCNWGIRNDAYWKSIAGGIPNYDDLYDGWIKTAKGSEYQAFTFNNESVRNQVAAIGEIYTTDMKLLYLGFAEDPAADIANVQAKLEAAGAAEVYEEMTRQAKEWHDALK
ncbi:MAG: ABC transporter substrate-binding protein [Lachnospiraceae bacterium]|nr:ABC transporter substrate-binding protein [Lachnospiraceae bacterium]